MGIDVLVWELSTWGLVLNMAGAISLGISTQLGMSVGGIDKEGTEVTWIEMATKQIRFKSHLWVSINAIGWFLLFIGFLLQFLGA
jgi:hypothetical protein